VAGFSVVVSKYVCVFSNYCDGHNEAWKIAQPDMMITAYHGGQCHAGTQPGQYP
jgi:hypothetical protein